MKAIGIIPLHKHLRNNRLAAGTVQFWRWCLGWRRTLAASGVFAVALSILLLPLSSASYQTEEVAPIYSILYSFKAFPDAQVPFAGLVRDASGNLYGTTVTGGSAQEGAIFKLDPSGKETVLYSFAGPPTDGANPFSGLIRDGAGNFYGTTYNGGTSFSSEQGIFGGVSRIELCQGVLWKFKHNRGEVTGHSSLAADPGACVLGIGVPNSNCLADIGPDRKAR